MKPILIATFVSLWMSILCSAEPRLSCSRVVDLGLINSKSSIPIAIDCTNNGDSELVLSEFSSSCSCTRPNQDKLVIQKGETKPIQFDMRIGIVTGIKTASVAFKTNDPENHLVKVDIRAVVGRNLQATPESVDYFWNRDNEKPVKKVVFRNEMSNTKIEAYELFDFPDYIKGTVTKFAPDVIEMEIEVLPSVPSGQIFQQVGVRAKIDGKYQMERIRISGQFKKSQGVAPEIIFLGDDWKLGKTIAKVAIKGFDPEKYQLSFNDECLTQSVDFLVQGDEIQFVSKEKTRFQSYCSGSLIVKNIVDNTFLVSVPVYTNGDYLKPVLHE